MSESGRLRQGGTVIISVVIGTDGKTSEIKVFKSSGNDVLDEKVAHAMEHYLYIPGSINGQVVPMRILISWYIESSLGMAFPTILHP
jgi:TonB family protein